MPTDIAKRFNEPKIEQVFLLKWKKKKIKLCIRFLNLQKRNRLVEIGINLEVSEEIMQAGDSHSSLERIVLILITHRIIISEFVDRFKYCMSILPAFSLFFC